MHTDRRIGVMALVFVILHILFGPTLAIVDTVPPRIKFCPQNIYRTVPVGTGKSKPIYWRRPIAEDNVRVSKTSFTFSPGTRFPVSAATIPVTYTFCDAARNCATCVFFVKVTEANYKCTSQSIRLDHRPDLAPSPRNITSPNFPLAYPVNSNCQWEVKKSTGNFSSANGIVVRFRAIELHGGDILVLRAMGDTTGQALTYSGRVPPRVLRVQGEGLTINLQSGGDNPVVYSVNGFDMEVQEIKMKEDHAFCHDGYQCKTSAFCIAERYLCDRIIDCPRGDDEESCGQRRRIESLPFSAEFNPSDDSGYSARSCDSSANQCFEWSFAGHVEYQITLNFPPPGNDRLVIQNPSEEFGHDTVALKRHPSTYSLHYNGTGLVVRLYPGIEAMTSPNISILVQSIQQTGYCVNGGYQCIDSRFCIDVLHDCNGFIDCPRGDDERDCERRCPDSCRCNFESGHLSIINCQNTWSSQLSKSAPDITTELVIALKDLGSIGAGFFEGLTNLNNLVVTSSKVTGLDSGALSGLVNLQCLKLRNNSLTRLASDTFTEVPNLVELELTSNRLNDLDLDVFQSQSKLESLFLQDNHMTILHPGVFRSLHNLKELYLQDNYISHLPEGIFQGLVKLKNLKLMSNRISRFSPGLLQELLDLEEIDISSNGITNLAGETLHGLVKLKKISVELNNLTHFEDGFFSNFTHLEGIYSRNNDIQFIQPTLFQGLVNLTCIDLRNNRLREIPHDALQGLTKLSQLYLSGNELVDLDPRLLEGHTQLDKLELNNNNLSTLQPGHFRDLSKLSSLYLSNNTLAILRNGTFEGLSSVGDLLLDSSGIEEMEPGAFEGLSALATLDLRFNGITELRKGVFDGMVNLHHLYLSGNPLIKIDPSVFDALPRLQVVMTHSHSLCCFLNASSVICDVGAQAVPPYFTCERRLLAQDVMKAFIWLQVLFAISGNLVVLVWRGHQIKSHRRKTQILLILNLAASDLLMGLYLLMIASADLHFGESFLMQMASWRTSLTCKVAGVIGLVSSEASVFLVTLISVDRFLGVIIPMRRQGMSASVAAKVVAGVWVLAIGLSVAASTLSSTNDDFYELSNVCLGLPLSTKPTNVTATRGTAESEAGNVAVNVVDVSGDKPAWVFPIVLFLGVNLVSFLVIFACYVAIFVWARKTSRRAERTAARAEELRMAFKMGLIVGTDFCCWVPVIIMGILSQSGLVQIEQTMYAWVVIFILPINSSINPWLYTLSTFLPVIRKRLSRRRDRSSAATPPLTLSTSSTSAAKSPKKPGHGKTK